MHRLGKWMVYGLGVVAFLAPLKFGTPVVLQSAVLPPLRGVEWLVFSWPNQLGVLVCFGMLAWLLADRSRRAAKVDTLLVLPAAFLLTQAIALPGAINETTAVATTLHFVTCVLLFYVAASYLRDGAALEKVFAGLGLATFLVCVVAMEQWWGGLEATRDYAAGLGATAELPPEVLARLQSRRVFATLVYPNALAGFLVVAAAPVLAWIWVRGRTWDQAVKWATLVLVGGVMLFCLVLTGSRGGFLALGAVAVSGLWFCFGSRRKGLVIGVLVGLGAVFAVGLATGLVKTSSTSLAARFHYWEGAVKIARDHPLRGTGPGTFGSIYPQYKTGDTEEAQLAHNHYVQMWCDSGVLAFVLFAALWVVALRDGWRLVRQRPGDAGAIAIVAALIGWVVHGFFDFDLHVPGVAYPAFILLGAVQGLKQPPAVAAPSAVERYPRLGWVAALILVLGIAWVEGRSLAAAFLHAEGRVLESANPVGAYELVQRATRLEPANARYLVSAGDLALGLGRKTEAIRWYEQAVEHDRYRASHYWRLAQVSVDKDLVLKYLRHACELNPTRREYRQALETLTESIRHPSPDLLQSVPANGS